ncbi:hypothetical protein EVAR_101671_1, partial [Eumeta japonica]
MTPAPRSFADHPAAAFTAKQPEKDFCTASNQTNSGVVPIYLIQLRRTKPAQHSQYTQEMRELQQLPDNLMENSPTSSNGTTDHSMHQHIATVAPAKQRLSSFRASSEQLQLLSCSRQQQAASTK